MWITSKNLIREVFDGSFLKFEERPNVAPDQTNCIILASVANDPQYTDDTSDGMEHDPTHARSP